MSNEPQQVYTIIAMAKRFSNPEQTEPTDAKTYQVTISGADRQTCLTIDRHSWENFTLGDTVIYDGQTLWHEGMYPSFPIVAEVA